MITNKDIEKLKTVFATKEDLKRFATKEDLDIRLAKYATKEDLDIRLAKYATKKDLDDNLKNHPNRTEMQQMGVDIISTIEKLFNDNMERIDTRLSKIENKLTEILMWKPVLADHEARIQDIETKQEKTPN